MNAPITTLGPIEPTLSTIEDACRKLGAARDDLRGTVELLQADIKRAQDRYRRELQRRIDAVANAHAIALELVQAAPSLFAKPRSYQWHGVKVGYQKGRGKIEVANEDKFPDRVDQYCPGERAALVKTTHKPVLAALANLDAKLLKRLGVTITDADDEAFVKAVDSELDKLVKALVDAATEEAQEAGK